MSVLIGTRQGAAWLYRWKMAWHGPLREMDHLGAPVRRRMGAALECYGGEA